MENNTMPDTPVKILYAEDDKDAAHIYQIHLRRAGFQTDVVTDGRQALDLYEKNAYDLILLDMDLPLLGGEEVLRHIRSKGDTIPVIILSTVNHCEALYNGADDYLVKGGGIRDLQARLDKALARSRQMNAGRDPNIFRLSPLTTYNRATRILVINGDATRLGNMESKILWHFCLRVNELIPAPTLCEHLWNLYNKSKDDALRRYITFLRKSLRPDPTLAIVNDFGNGYRLTAPGT